MQEVCGYWAVLVACVEWVSMLCVWAGVFGVGLACFFWGVVVSWVGRNVGAWATMMG